VKLFKKRSLASGSSTLLPLARGQGLCRSFLAASFLLLLLFSQGVEVRPLSAQDEDADEASREYRIKAAYLYQFGRYIEWPPKSFPAADSPFIIGVMKQDPILPDLEQIAKLKKIQNRTIRILKFTGVSDVQTCHILYLSKTVAAETQSELIRKMARTGTLVVGDDPTTLEVGGVMQFVVEDNKIRIVISQKAAKREGLTISAKLLQVARIVD
jgi:hypothetical protein